MAMEPQRISRRAAAAACAANLLLLAALAIVGATPPPAEQQTFAVALMTQLPAPIAPVPEPKEPPVEEERESDVDVPRAALPIRDPLPEIIAPEDTPHAVPAPPRQPPPPLPPEWSVVMMPPLPAAWTPPPPPQLAQATVQADQVASNYLATVSARIAGALRYPALARQRGQEGTVNLQIAIGETGDLIDVGITQSDAPSFTRAALAATRRAAPFPTPPDDLPQPIRLSVPVAFRLL